MYWEQWTKLPSNARSLLHIDEKRLDIIINVNSDSDAGTVTTSRVADAIEASHMVKSSSAVEQNP